MPRRPPLPNKEGLRKTGSGGVMAWLRLSAEGGAFVSREPPPGAMLGWGFSFQINASISLANGDLSD